MEQGEGKMLLEQIRSISQDVLDNLKEIDRALDDLTTKMREGTELDKEEWINAINQMRIKISGMEKEDSEEIEDEIILENMIEKLDNLIKITLG